MQDDKPSIDMIQRFVGLMLSPVAEQVYMDIHNEAKSKAELEYLKRDMAKTFSAFYQGLVLLAKCGNEESVELTNKIAKKKRQSIRLVK